MNSDLCEKSFIGSGRLLLFRHLMRASEQCWWCVRTKREEELLCFKERVGKLHKKNTTKQQKSHLIRCSVCAGNTHRSKHGRTNWYFTQSLAGVSWSQKNKYITSSEGKCCLRLRHHGPLQFNGDSSYTKICALSVFDCSRLQMYEMTQNSQLRFTRSKLDERWECKSLHIKWWYIFPIVFPKCSGAAGHMTQLRSVWLKGREVVSCNHPALSVSSPTSPHRAQPVGL